LVHLVGALRCLAGLWRNLSVERRSCWPGALKSLLLYWTLRLRKTLCCRYLTATCRTYGGSILILRICHDWIGRSISRQALRRLLSILLRRSLHVEACCNTCRLRCASFCLDLNVSLLCLLRILLLLLLLLLLKSHLCFSKVGYLCFCSFPILLNTGPLVDILLRRLAIALPMLLNNLVKLRQVVLILLHSDQNGSVVVPSSLEPLLALGSASWLFPRIAKLEFTDMFHYPRGNLRLRLTRRSCVLCGLRLLTALSRLLLCWLRLRLSLTLRSLGAGGLTILFLPLCVLRPHRIRDLR